jgi:RimJ/RimL family protein N-acetyltransferase
MHTLLPTDYERARPLYAAAMHSRSFPFAVLDGLHVGRVRVDDAERPHVALVDMAAGFYVFGGDASRGAAIADAVREVLAAPGDEVVFFLALSPEWQRALDGALAAYGPMWVRRIEFAFDERAFASLPDARQALPAGCAIAPYDADLAASAGGLAEMWGDLDRFLASGVGVALLVGGAPVSRCHTVFVGDRIAETSVETDEAHRRQGYALRACCAYITACLERGLTPAWSCCDNNIPSIALARRLGYGTPCEVPVAILRRPPREG